MESLIYLPACEDIAKKDLAFILQHCTSLTSFTFRPHHTLQPPDTTNEALNSQQWYDCDWIWDVAEGTPGAVLASRCVSTLRELDLQHELDLSKLTRIHDMLSVQPRLTTLILGPGVLDNTESSNLKSLSRIVLPHLEELQVWFHPPGVRNHISATWTLPCLQRLTLLGCCEFPLPILRSFGTNLRYLHLAPHITAAPVLDEPTTWTADKYTLEFPQLGELCPNLEHLVLRDVPIANPQCIIASPTLRYLDLWMHPQTAARPRMVELLCEMGRECNLPSLLNLRILSLDPYVLRVLPPRFPLICHPSMLEGDTVRLWTFPGIRVLQTRWALLPDFGWVDGGFRLCFADDPWDDDSNASAFEEADEDDGECTSWISDSGSDSYSESPNDGDGVEDGDTDSDDGYPEVYGRLAILERFAQSQREDFLFDDD